MFLTAPADRLLITDYRLLSVLPEGCGPGHAGSIQDGSKTFVIFSNLSVRMSIRGGCDRYPILVGQAQDCFVRVLLANFLSPSG